MSEKQEYVEIQIPQKDYDQLAKLADKLGRNIDDLVVEAILEGIKRADEKISKQETDDEIVTVNVRLGKWFHDFIKDYLEFIGSTDTVEDFCRDAIFGDIDALQDQLHGLDHFNAKDFFNKYPHVCMLDTKGELEAEAK